MQGERVIGSNKDESTGSSRTNASAIGRLLEEISWEGPRVRAYRDGGRGLENVLTTEAFMLLDFLPRTYLAAVLAAANGAEDTRARLQAESEEAAVALLPDGVMLAGTQTEVQPDAWIRTPTVQVLVEAKRIRRSAFQSQQLARELLVVREQAGDRRPLLLLVLGEAPPVAVKGAGRLGISEAISHGLSQMTDLQVDGQEVLERLDEWVAWTTWATIREVVSDRLQAASGGRSALASEQRLATALVRAIDWHA